MDGLACEGRDTGTVMIDATFPRSRRTASGLRVKRGRGRLIGLARGGMDSKLHADTGPLGRTIGLVAQRRSGIHIVNPM